MLSGPALAQETAPAAPAVDFGNFSSETLAGKAWAAMDARDYAGVKVYAEKCREMYGKQAEEMQQKLTAPAPKEQAFDYWALNDVGTSAFLLGQALEKQGDTKGAIASYKYVVEKTPFAQCWDPKGWFWKPADAASARLKALEFDSME
jgi:hypothetical protein